MLFLMGNSNTLTTTEPLWENELNRIAQVADIHIPKAIKRHEEYAEVFDNLCIELKEAKPDRIVVVGDLYHDKLTVSNEANTLAAKFLTGLRKIAPVIITRGNHDFNIKTKHRVDCIETLVGLIQRDGITYYNRSGFYVDENIVWVVWHHGDHYSPWNEVKKTPEERVDDFYATDIDRCIERFGSVEKMRELGFRFIDLFHDPINGCKTPTGMSMEKDTYLRLGDFEGDNVLMGDIHKRQHFN